MGVNLIFKIAAVGIFGVGDVSGVEAQRARGPGVSHESRRIDPGAVLDRAVYL